MYSIADLGKTIADIQEHNKSGVLMISGESPSKATTSTTFSLRFESGELARLSGPDNVLGQEALLALLTLEQLMPPRWFPLNASSGWNGEAQIKRKDFASILGLATAPGDMSVQAAIEAGAAAGSQAKQQEADNRAGVVLVKRIHAVFMSVYLGDTKADLAEVAKRHPPATEPEAFTEACIHLLEPMLGAEAARAMLSD